MLVGFCTHRQETQAGTAMLHCWHTNNCAETATPCTLKMHFYVTQTPSPTTFPWNSCQPFHHSLFSSPFSLHRCERTGLMRFVPSMPLTQRHRDTVPTTGWILALALLLALQVICSNKIAISERLDLPRAFVFSFPLFSFNLLYLADMFINCLWAQIQSNYILASLGIKEKWWFRLSSFFSACVLIYAFIELWLINLGIILANTFFVSNRPSEHNKNSVAT